MSVCCYIRRAVMICVCTLGTVSLGAEFRVDTVDGMKIEGTVVSCDDGGLRLSVAGNETDIALDNVSKLTAINATGTDRPPSGIHLQLIGGTDLFVDQFSSDANQSTMTFADGTRQVIAASLVRTARLKSPSEEFNERWRELASGEYETDVLVIRKSGGNLDFVKGIIGAIGETHVGFEFDGQEIQVARERIEGLVYFTKSKDAPGEAFCRVSITSGGSIRGQGLKWDGDHFVVAIGRDAQLTLPPQLIQTVEFASNERAADIILTVSSSGSTSGSWT